MFSYQFLYAASLVVFIFGALSFSVLTLFYWREPRRRAGVFPVFTLACAAAFVLGLLLQVVTAPLWAAAMGLARQLATGLIPPLMLHLVYEDEGAHLRAAKAWRRGLAAYYILAVAAAAVNSLADAGVLPPGWAAGLDRAPAVAWGVTAALGSLLQASSRRPRRPRWIPILFILMLFSAAANLLQPGPFVGLAPDYLLLAFFAATLYYRERLVFFDLLIKRGAFFAIGLLGFTVFFAFRPVEQRPWIGALLLSPLWLAGPWVFERLSRFIDRVFLKRRYAPAEAERQFVEAVQAAAAVPDVRARAESSLAAIFQTKAEVQFESRSGLAPIPPGLAAECGRVSAALSPRPDGIPFLSDDVRLLHSLVRTLDVVLENVRLRQQRREEEIQRQELRLLASRAELKALRAQINPHFLFNALNAIAGLIQERPQLADETIEHLAQVFRYTLRKSDAEWVRLEEEVEFIAAYLRVEQARFGERLRVEFDVDPAAGGVPIPAMSIQPLIENAIRHGASAVEGCGVVRLRARLAGGALEIEVFDNGPGFPAGFDLERCPDGHGLRNVMRRLRGYYGEAAELQWENGGGGCRVWLKAPRLAGDERCAF
ncbi:MAG: histidine kinase [Acidobacteriia bacterium]|nr:histidine kinase [Terriglobia bacterium]